MNKNKQDKLYSLPLPGFVSGFAALFTLFLPHRVDKEFLAQTADDYLRDTWRQVGNDLRSAMDEYDKLSSVWK